MDDPNRRELLTSAAALAAAVGLPALTAAQDEKAKPADPTDRERIIAAGLTAEEADCWEAVANAAGKFFALPKLHVMDDHEVTHAIHVLQYRLLARPTYRKYLELSKAAAKDKKPG